MYTREEVKEKTLEYFNNDELAADVWMNKYALKDNEGNYLELTPDDMHRRLAKEFARIEAKYPNPLSEEEIYEKLVGFKFLIPQGSPMAAIGDDNRIQSISNCFVTPHIPLDSYASICYTDQQIVQVLKRRGGIGTDISNIRPKGMVVQNAAQTTDGIACFMERFSNSTREVASQGRRGALMLTIDIRHPEIETFITVKRNLDKVTGANISIKIWDDFMEAVGEDKDYELYWPVTAKTDEEKQIRKTVKAKDIWNLIVESNWLSAEPGILFFDQIVRESPADCYGERWRTQSTNPCFTGDMKLLTKEGYKTFAELEKEDWFDITDPILNSNSENKTGFVTRKYNEGSVNIVKLKIEDKVIFCTVDHKFLTKNSYNEIGMTCALYLSEKYEVFDIERNKWVQVGCVENILSDEIVYDFTNTHSHMGIVNGIITANCGELPLNPGGACRLFLLNLMGYVRHPYTDKAEFEYAKFRDDVRIAQRLMDDIVDLELEKIDKIIEKVKSDPEPDHIKAIELTLWEKIRENCEFGRRTGLGVTALGDCLISLGMVYGSPKSIDMAETIYERLAVNAYISSFIMAKERGAFPVYEYEKEKDSPFINRLLTKMDREWVEVYKQHGRRNIAILTTAPCGSVSICSQTTSGFEPPFMLSYMRRRKIYSSERENKKADFIDKLGDKWEHYEVNHKGVEEWLKINQGKKIEDSPYFDSIANKIDWKARVEMQGRCNAFIDHSISSTINLPKDVTKDKISEIYLHAWKNKCKGITVYRDGCRSGVVVSSDEKKDDEKKSRPDLLPCHIHRARVDKQDWTILIGLNDGIPYEVFAGYSENIEIPKKYEEGEIIKVSRKTLPNRYDLVIGNGDGVKIKDIVNTFDNPTHGTFCRMLSSSLRHGAPISYVIEQLRKDKNSPLHSLHKVIARILDKYIEDGEKSEDRCIACGEKGLVYQEGCLICHSCGASACG